jgi:hypothetical protein
MATKIRWERGVAGQVAAHLLSDDGGHALVHCMIPGGRPRFLPRLDSRWDTEVVGAPSCDSFAAFKRFVTERFGDDAGEAGRESGRATYLSTAILLAVALVMLAMVGNVVADLLPALETAATTP